MEKCGYRVTSDDLAARLGAGATLDSNAHTGWKFEVYPLIEAYHQLGLEAEAYTRKNGDITCREASCKICGIFDKTNIGRVDGVQHLQCDPEKHRAFYDAF